MWPSMVRHAPSSKRASKQPLAGAPLADREVGNIERHLDSLKAADGGKSSRQQEMEKLERWLDMGSEDEDEPYTLGKINGSLHWPRLAAEEDEDAWPASSTSRLEDRTPDLADGFEDNFSEFVSAPATQSGVDEGNVKDADTDSDADMPSKADVRAAAARIFGLPHPSASTSSDPSLPSGTDFSDALKSFDSELDMDAPAFDLSQILGALEGMKAEVALIPDEATRRKAAARVALGLVYGLEDMRDLDEEVLDAGSGKDRQSIP